MRDGGGSVEIREEGGVGFGVGDYVVVDGLIEKGGRSGFFCWLTRRYHCCWLVARAEDRKRLRRVVV